MLFLNYKAINWLIIVSAQQTRYRLLLFNIVLMLIMEILYVRMSEAKKKVTMARTMTDALSVLYLH